MTMRGSKDVVALIRTLTRMGIEVKQTRGGSVQVRCPDGGKVHFHLTPSDPRAIKNIRADLRRHGVTGI